MKDFGEALENSLGGIRADLAFTIQHAASRGDRCTALRAYYLEVWKRAKTLPPCDWAIDPHEIDWGPLFTPIEQDLWEAIRQERIVMYPQHPVAGFFVDFGNPKARVAIECDGKAFHLDAVRDRQRQSEIEAKGWHVYRFSGTDCLLSDYTATRDADGEEAFVPSYARRWLREIAHRHTLSRKHLEQR